MNVAKRVEIGWQLTQKEKQTSEQKKSSSSSNINSVSAVTTIKLQQQNIYGD